MTPSEKKSLTDPENFEVAAAAAARKFSNWNVLKDQQASVIASSRRRSVVDVKFHGEVRTELQIHGERLTREQSDRLLIARKRAKNDN